MNANGSWTLPLSSTVLSALPDGTVNVIVTVTDSAGNSSTTTGSAEALFHTLPSATAVLPFGDGYLNLDESTKPQTLSGKTGISGSGQTVTVTLDAGTANQQVFTGVQVDGLGGWSLPLTSTQLAAFTEGGHTLLVTVTDKAGNPRSAIVNVTAASTLPTPNITESLFGDDNTLNNSELATAQTINGTASFAEVGRFVSVMLNGKTYQAQDLDNGSGTGGIWSVSVPTADLNALSQGQHPITATLKDAAGNSTNADPLSITVDTDIPLLTINAFAGNNILTMAEALLGQTLSGKGEAGATVTLTAGPLTSIPVNIDNDGNWQIPFTTIDLTKLTDGPQVIGLTITDAAGNSNSTTVTLNVALNQTLGAGVDDIFGNNGILNYSESLITQVISGHATGSSLGAKVSVTIAGTTFETTVGVSGAWSVSFPPSALSGLSDGLLQVEVDIVDVNGNSKNELVDIHVLRSVPTIDSILAFGGNGLGLPYGLNALEAAADQIISGVVGNIDTTKGAYNITVTLGTKTYTTTVGASGAWNLSIPTLDLKALQDGTLALGVSVTDYGSNVVSKTINVPVIINKLPSLTLDPIFGDGLLNLADLVNSQTISGTALNLAPARN